MNIFPTKHEAKIAVLILAFITGLGVGMYSAKSFVFFAEALGTLVATFAGAYFAFKLDKKKKQEELDKENVRGANKAIFNLMKIYQAAECYRRQFIEDFVDSPLRYVSIRPSLGFQSWMENFDFESLSYLFESVNPNILMDIYELQQEVASTIELVQERNRIYLERIEAPMKSAGINQGDNVSESDFVRILEQYDIDTMKNYTDELIRSVGSIIERSERLTRDMYNLNINAYPSYTIIRMQKVHN